MHQNDKTESFVSQVMDIQRKLYVYILTLEPKQADADDILQEANLVIWRKREDFQENSNLWSWVCRIAHYEVLAFRKRRGQDRLQFNDALTEKLACETTGFIESLSPRREALSACLEKLSEEEHNLLKQRYTDTLSANVIAKQSKRTVGAIYQALHRIRTSLMKCINRKLLSDKNQEVS